MRTYGPTHTPEDTTRCVVETRGSSGRNEALRQCRLARGHGPEGLYCARHAMMLDVGITVSVPDEEEVAHG